MAQKKFILSSGDKANCYGFRLDLSGLDISRFTTNPVMLYMHDAGKVIGRWDGVAVEDGKLTASAVFDTADMFSKDIAGKVERGFLRGCSIGIVIHKMRETKGEMVVTSSELMEASIVSVPADADAVVLYDANRKIISLDEAKLNVQKLNQQLSNMEKEKFELPQTTLVSLGITGELTPQGVELAVAEKDRRIAELEAELQQQKDKAVEAYLAAAVKAGKIKETDKPSFLKLAKTDLESVKAIIDAKAEQASASLADMTQKTTLAAGREDWNYIKWMQEDPAGLKKLKADNPAAFERLQATIRS
ncbi:MAG: HK97 family phage prohead protease [Prevotellaceae bacterium]|jgi:HK97 family phage prohead protease|nr:HK97 family phage prohead protease [Prevotellaceae bacterium]